jgi:hypothetical protein
MAMPKKPIMTKPEKRQLMYSPKVGVMPFTKEEYEATLKGGGKKGKAAKKPKGKRT